MNSIYGGGGMEMTEYEVQRALRVLAWSGASAIVTFLLATVSAIDVNASATWVAVAVPVVNAALYAVKEFIADNREKVL